MLLQFYGMWSDVQLHDIISTGVRNPRAGRNKIISPCTNRKAEKKFCKLCMYSGVTVLSAVDAILRADKDVLFVLTLIYQGGVL